MTDDSTPPPRHDPQPAPIDPTGNRETFFRDPPSRKAPIHDLPTPIVESDEITKLRAIIRHWASGMRTPWNEPEYVEAVARLKELMAAPPPPRPDPPPMTAARQSSMDKIKIASLKAQIAALTAQRDAAVAGCQAMLDPFGYERDDYGTFRCLVCDCNDRHASNCPVPIAETAVALCSPAPAEPRQGGDGAIVATGTDRPATKPDYKEG